MAREKKQSKKTRVVMSNRVDWVMIDKRTNTVIGVFNPEGNNGALRRVAIQSAVGNSLAFANLRLLPVTMMDAEEFKALDIDNAPRLVDPKAKK